MNSYVAWGIFGIISGLIASFADVPLVMPNQSENLKLGGVCPWWGDVTSKRFKVSFWLSFLGQPGGYIVMWLLADMISNGNVALAGILKVMTLLGCYTGLMSHVVFCLKPLLYQIHWWIENQIDGFDNFIAFIVRHFLAESLVKERFQDHRSPWIWICAAFGAAHYCGNIKN